MKTSTNTLIVGGGLAGSLLTYQLLERGVDFKLIDASLPKASMVAAGIYNPMVFRRLVKSWMADELIPYLNLFYRKLEKELNSSFFHPMNFYKILGEQEGRFWLEREKLTATKPYLSPDIEFPEGFNAIHHPYGMAQVFNAGWVNLSVMIDGLHQLFANNNCIANHVFDYSKLAVQNDAVTYGDFSAKRIIFCEGSHIGENPWFSFLRFKHTKGELITIQSKSLQLDAILNKNGFILPLGNDLYKVGATYQWDDLSTNVTAESKAILIEKLENMIKAPYEIIAHEAGIRPTSNDRRPVLGAHQVHENVFVFNGLGTKGVMLAPFFSNHLAEHIFTGVPLISEVDVKRFNTKM